MIELTPGQVIDLVQTIDRMEAELGRLRAMLGDVAEAHEAHTVMAAITDRPNAIFPKARMAA